VTRRGRRGAPAGRCRAAGAVLQALANGTAAWEGDEGVRLPFKEAGEYMVKLNRTSR
jgi:hypothetical protein